MKRLLIIFPLIGLGALMSDAIPLRAATDTSRANEIIALEKSLAATREELSTVKTALAIAQSKLQAAESRPRVATQPEAEVNVLTGQVRLLERDLQSATNALKNLAAEKTALESSVVEANEKLVEATKELETLRTSKGAATDGSAVGADQRIAELQSQLDAVQSKLSAAEKASELRESELAKLRGASAAAEARPPASVELASMRMALAEAQQRLNSVTQELEQARSQLAAGRALEERVRQLEGEKASAANRAAESQISKEEFERLTGAHADAKRELAAAQEAHASLMRERDELRARASKAAELEARVRQLEAGARNASASTSDSGTSKDEIARVSAALAAAESKLATALRSFTLVSRERDELRARVAELMAKTAGEKEKR